MKTCLKCNLSYDDDKKFCKKCGDPLKSEYQIDPKNVAKKSVLEDRLKADPLNIELLHEYSQFLFNNQLFKEAISVSYKILAINENDGVANEILFKAYHKLNMFKETLEIGQQLLTEKPTDIFLLEELAKIANELGNSGKAAEYFDKILGLQPSNATVLYSKALILLENNQLEKAIEIFNRLYLEGHNDRITKIYVGIDKALNGDFDTAIDLLVPILSDENINLKDLDNNRGFLYLGYSLRQKSADILEVSQWFSKIDFEVLKSDHNQLVEQTVVAIVTFIIYHDLIEINLSSDANSQIRNLIESYLPDGYYTANSNTKIADIWYSIGNKQVELQLLADAVNSFQKASDLCPNETNYKEKCLEIKKTLENANSKNNISLIIVLVIFAICLIVLWKFR